MNILYNLILILIIFVFIYLSFYSYLENILKIENFYNIEAEDGTELDDMEENDLTTKNVDDDDDENNEDTEGTPFPEPFQNPGFIPMISDFFVQIFGKEIFESFMTRPIQPTAPHGRSRSRRRRKRIRRRRRYKRVLHSYYNSTAYKNYKIQLAKYNAWLEAERLRKERERKAAIKKRNEQLAKETRAHTNVSNNNTSASKDFTKYSQIPQDANTKERVRKGHGQKFNAKLNGYPIGPSSRHPFLLGPFNSWNFNKRVIDATKPTFNRGYTLSSNKGNADVYINQETKSRIYENQVKKKEGKFSSLKDYAKNELDPVYKESIGNIKSLSEYPDSIWKTLKNDYFKNDIKPEQWLTKYYDNAITQVDKYKKERRKRLDIEKERLRQIKLAADLKAAQDARKLANQAINQVATERRGIQKSISLLKQKQASQKAKFYKDRDKQFINMNRNLYNANKNIYRTRFNNMKPTIKKRRTLARDTHLKQRAAIIKSNKNLGSIRNLNRKLNTVNIDNIKDLALDTIEKTYN